MPSGTAYAQTDALRKLIFEVMKYHPSVLVFLTALSISGCASIMHGTTQSVGVSSVPSGAAVSINGQNFGTTPAFVNLSRKDQHVVSISMPGYQTQELTLTKSVSGWVWGNIVFGGVIGLAVDAVSGGLYKLSPEQLMASLDASTNAGIDDDGSSIFVQIVLEPNEAWQKIGELQAREIEATARFY